MRHAFSHLPLAIAPPLLSSTIKHPPSTMRLLPLTQEKRENPPSFLRNADSPPQVLKPKRTSVLQDASCKILGNSGKSCKSRCRRTRNRHHPSARFQHRVNHRRFSINLPLVRMLSTINHQPSTAHSNHRRAASIFTRSEPDQRSAPHSVLAYPRVVNSFFPKILAVAADRHV